MNRAARYCYCIAYGIDAAALAVSKAITWTASLVSDFFKHMGSEFDDLED